MITEDFILFFQDLESNNRKDWFHANKYRYETAVKNPFLNMIQQVLDHLNAESEVESGAFPELAKETLFRINRNLRFSTDKRPYHTIIKASITKGGKKSSLPGIYLAADAKKLRLGGGLWQIQPKILKDFRHYLAENISELKDLSSANGFQSLYGEIKGDKFQKTDALVVSALEQHPLLLHKQFYFMVEYPIEIYLNQDLSSFIIHHISTGKEINQFFTKAINYANDQSKTTN